MEVSLSLAEENPLKIQVDNCDYHFMRDLADYFTKYAPGYRFHPKFQAGVWDGRICVMDKLKRQFPYGLLSDFLKFRKEHYPSVSIDIVDERISSLFKGDSLEYNWDLCWPPRQYQENCIRSACEYKRNIFKVATAGGKSLILAYIWKVLFENKKISKQLIIVPTTGLITQFKKDWISYGIDESYLGEVWAEEKQWEKKVVISTWQSLKNYPEQLQYFDSVFVDEVHSSKAQVLSDILANLQNAEYRIGCTGTMPDGELDDLNIRSYLGPVLEEYTASYLKERGFIADSIIKQIFLNYESKFPGDYNKAKTEIFQNPFRLNVLKNIVSDVKEGSCLLLVGKVADEGEYLQNYLQSFSEFNDREIVFISGKMKKAEREYWRLRAFDQDRKLVIISTYPVFQAGINIPNLAHVVFAAPFKAKIRILQSIGRALRLHESKVCATIYDLVDNGNKWFPKHGDTRFRYYQREEFNVEEHELYEQKGINDVNLLSLFD